MGIIFFRTLIVYVSLLFAMRMMGKRQLGELELSELVIAVLISDIAAHPLQDIGIPLMNGILPIIILFSCELVVAGILVRSQTAKKILCGKPSFLIYNGTIVQREMQKNRFTIDELAEELRTHSVMDFSRVQYAILETDGQVNAILYPADRPVTAAQLSLPTENSGYPIILINNGKLVQDNLRVAGKDERWLKKELSKRKVSDYKEVYLFTVNSANEIYFLKMEDAK